MLMMSSRQVECLKTRAAIDIFPKKFSSSHSFTLHKCSSDSFPLSLFPHFHYKNINAASIFSFPSFLRTTHKRFSSSHHRLLVGSKICVKLIYAKALFLLKMKYFSHDYLPYVENEMLRNWKNEDEREELRKKRLSQDKATLETFTIFSVVTCLWVVKNYKADILCFWTSVWYIVWFFVK